MRNVKWPTMEIISSKYKNIPVFLKIIHLFSPSIEPRTQDMVRFSGGKLVHVDKVREAVNHYRSPASGSRPLSSMQNTYRYF